MKDFLILVLNSKLWDKRQSSSLMYKMSVNNKKTKIEKSISYRTHNRAHWLRCVRPSRHCCRCRHWEQRRNSMKEKKNQNSCPHAHPNFIIIQIVTCVHVIHFDIFSSVLLSFSVRWHGFCDCAIFNPSDEPESFENGASKRREI